MLNHRDVVLDWLLSVWLSTFTDNSRFIIAFPWEEQVIIYWEKPGKNCVFTELSGNLHELVLLSLVVFSAL